MYCSTCGARVPPGRRTCDTCGASLLPTLYPGSGLPPAPPQGRWGLDRGMGSCPRCGYHGEGVAYFARGSHVAALVAATVFTAGAMGAGGVVYYLMRRDHRVCPRCGRGWGRYGERALVRHSGRPAPTQHVPGSAPERGKRGASIALLIMAALMMVGGIVGTELAPILVGLMAAAGAFVLHKSANREREERRIALIAALQPPVLKLAAARGGKLTVTEVAAELGWSLPRAEKVLNSLDDGVRVDSQVTDEGVIVYYFLEIPRGPDTQLLP